MEAKTRIFGHVTHMHNEQHSHIVLHGYVNTTRQDGRPRKRRLDNISDDRIVLGISLPHAERLANDRRT